MQGWGSRRWYTPPPTTRQYTCRSLTNRLTASVRPRPPSCLDPGDLIRSRRLPQRDLSPRGASRRIERSATYSSARPPGVILSGDRSQPGRRQKAPASPPIFWKLPRRIKKYPGVRPTGSAASVVSKPPAAAADAACAWSPGRSRLIKSVNRTEDTARRSGSRWIYRYTVARRIESGATQGNAIHLWRPHSPTAPRRRSRAPFGIDREGHRSAKPCHYFIKSRTRRWHLQFLREHCFRRQNGTLACQVQGTHCRMVHRCRHRQRCFITSGSSIRRTDNRGRTLVPDRARREDTFTFKPSVQVRHFHAPAAAAYVSSRLYPTLPQRAAGLMALAGHPPVACTAKRFARMQCPGRVDRRRLRSQYRTAQVLDATLRLLQGG